MTHHAHVPAAQHFAISFLFRRVLTHVREAFGRVLSTLQKMPAQRRDAILKKEPCLVLLALTPDRIKKKHKNDWVRVFVFFCLKLNFLRES